MEIIQVVIIGLVSTIIILLLKDERPEIAIQLSIACGIIIFFIMLSKITAVIQALEQIANKVNIDTVYLNTVLKIIGIAYISSFGVEICKDAGQNSIGSKIEFAGKILIIIMAMPIIMAIIDMIIKIMP